MYLLYDSRRKTQIVSEVLVDATFLGFDMKNLYVWFTKGPQRVNKCLLLPILVIMCALTWHMSL